ncbi:response regulator [Paenibacillus sp. LHD-38]|uniref:response regulator transcription factor n=1 Tax=Paenibacillus sp. LHD-38 TaxID=3072143 RepID=UPI0028105EFE|nr:response regulator [Paenibacillus sp. LHD-38]MDQ8738799.1 response regulator [Paenibacillus sp. LHD-38]
MTKLLIVDDEPYTVDGLYDMLSEVEGLSLELYTATSAKEAIQRLTRTRVDIVISDIQMPGMDGLELQLWIAGRWPRCKVIFLTGYGHIHYAQQAIRGGSVDYILKTEGDEAIVKSVCAAIDAIRKEAASDQFLLRAKSQLQQALPVLRKEWFYELTESNLAADSLSSAKFEQLRSELSAMESVLLVGGRVDRWSEKDRFEQQALLLYAIQNIAEEYFAHVHMLAIILEGSEFVWLIQPQTVEISEDVWKDTIAYVLATMESIQTACRTLLKLPVSLVCTGVPESWSRMGTVYSRLKKTMVLSLGNGEEMLISYCAEEISPAGSDGYRRSIAELERYLEANDEAEFRRSAEELFQRIPNRFGMYAQVYYGIAVLLLGQLNKLEPLDESAEKGLYNLLDIHAHRSKEEALQKLLLTATDLFKQHKALQDERTHRVIQKLNQHIRENLANDLSLDTLADLVHMNASYLSNLYKQYTGTNISDYITELRIGMAKDLLLNTPHKIHEIADLMGFGAAPYFTRYFKRHVGVTPQEYRG